MIERKKPRFPQFSGLFSFDIKTKKQYITYEAKNNDRGSGRWCITSSTHLEVSIMTKEKAIQIIIDISYLLADESDYEENIMPKLQQVINYINKQKGKHEN